MFFTDEPLGIWMSRDEAEHETRLAVNYDESLVEMEAALDQLQEMLDHPPAKGANLINSRVYGLGIWSMVRLPPDEIARAEDLYRRVYTTGGPGTTYVQEGLLFIIGASRQPASAVNDAAFSPRFQARKILRENELPVPFNNAQGVYACKVKFK